MKITISQLKKLIAEGIAEARRDDPVAVEPAPRALSTADAKNMSVGEYLDGRLADKAGNGEFHGGMGLSTAAAAMTILKEYLDAHGGTVPINLILK